MPRNNSMQGAEITAEVPYSQLMLERLRDPVVARGARMRVRGELGRPLPYQGMPDCLMNLASPASRQRAVDRTITRLCRDPVRHRHCSLRGATHTDNGKRVERLERKAMDPVSRGRQASEARDAAAQGILMSGALLIVESDAALAQSLHDGLAGLGYA